MQEPIPQQAEHHESVLLGEQFRDRRAVGVDGADRAEDLLRDRDGAGRVACARSILPSGTVLNWQAF